MKKKKRSIITPQVASVQPSQPIVVYQRKDTTSFTIRTHMKDTPVSVNVPKIDKEKDEIVGEDNIETLENDGTQGQTG